MRAGIAVCSLICLGMNLCGDLSFAARTELISKSVDGGSASGRSERPAISDSSRFIVFQSNAKDLVQDKTTSYYDIFLYDRTNRTMVNLTDPDGNEEANSNSYHPKISADGAVIVFRSDASNLVSGDDEGYDDIFAYVRATGVLERVSINSSGGAANGDCDYPDVSGNGRYVVFASDADNLAYGDTNGQRDIFRHDRVTGATIRVNYDFFGDEAQDYESTEPVISDDGNYVAFQSRSALTPCDDNNVADIFVRNIATATTSVASVSTYGCVSDSTSYHPSISATGRYVAFSTSDSDLVFGDDNGQQDVFLRDRVNETTTRVSVAAGNTEGDQRSVGYGGNISSNGRYIAFSTLATTFAGDDTNEGYDVYAKDLTTGRLTREGVGHYWEQGSQNTAAANLAVISADGRYIVFDSRSSDLVAGDDNGDSDIFIRDYLWPGPLVTNISPYSGDYQGGTLLTIQGSNFSSTAVVTIDGKVPLNVQVNSSGTAIYCITRPHTPGNVEIKVTNPNGLSWVYPVGNVNFNGYLYRPLPLPYLVPLLLSS